MKSVRNLEKLAMGTQMRLFAKLLHRFILRCIAPITLAGSIATICNPAQAKSYTLKLHQIGYINKATEIICNDFTQSSKVIAIYTNDYEADNVRVSCIASSGEIYFMFYIENEVIKAKDIDFFINTPDTKYSKNSIIHLYKNITKNTNTNNGAKYLYRNYTQIPYAALEVSSKINNDDE